MPADWGFYGGDAFGQHYSSLDQIKRENVENLTVALDLRTGELGDGFARSSKLTFERRPCSRSDSYTSRPRRIS